MGVFNPFKFKRENERFVKEWNERQYYYLFRKAAVPLCCCFRVASCDTVVAVSQDIYNFR